jgi:hypothetical protein
MMDEAGVEINPRQHQSETVRADYTQQVRARRIQHGLAQVLPPGTAPLAESGGYHNRCFRAAGAQLGDQFRDRIRRGGDHRQIRRFGQTGDVREAGMAIDGVTPWIDQIDVTLKTGGE